MDVAVASETIGNTFNITRRIYTKDQHRALTSTPPIRLHGVVLFSTGMTLPLPTNSV